VHIADTEPFAGGEAGAGLVQAVAGEVAAQGVRGDSANAMRRRIEGWARGRGLDVAESFIAREIEGVSVRVPMYAITEGTAVIEATALAPVKANVSTEPKTWLDRFRASASTGDQAFDRTWRTRSSDAALALGIIDSEVRDALREVRGWCRASYHDGRIEVRLDVPRMCGARLLEGISVAAALGRTRPASNAYR